MYMEKLVGNDLTKVLIILGLGFVGMLVVLVKLVAKVKGSFKPYQKATIVYLLISLIFFAAIACTGWWYARKQYLFFFMLYQFYFLLLGAVHIYSIRQHIKWSGKGALWPELLFTLNIGVIGSIVFLLIYRRLNPEGLVFDMATSIIFFTVPWFISQTFQKAIAIPAKILKQWFYPVNYEIAEPDEKKLKHLLVISFEFQKQVSDAHYTNFRARAPVDMELGELFYYFVNDYNERHPHSKIQYIDNEGEPQGWIFYKKPKWSTLITKYMDVNKTIFKNGIKENDVIICNRSLN